MNPRTIFQTIRVPLYRNDLEMTAASIVRTQCRIRNVCAGLGVDDVVDNGRRVLSRLRLLQCLSCFDNPYFKLELVVVDDEARPSCHLLLEKCSVYLFGVQAGGNRFYELKEKDRTKPRKLGVINVPLVGNVSYDDEDVDISFVPYEIVAGVSFIMAGEFMGKKNRDTFQKFVVAYITAFCEGARLGHVCDLVKECVSLGIPKPKSALICFLLHSWSHLSIAVVKALFRDDDTRLMGLIRQYKAIYGEDAILVWSEYHAATEIIKLFAMGSF